jgi:1-acyl-sn-glycerol-3-phosphate acyltransferase
VARYVVLSRFTGDGLKQLAEHPEVSDLRNTVEALDGKVVEQHFLLGDHDVLTVIDLPEAHLAQALFASPRTKRMVMPAIDQDLFARLMTQSAETVGPHRWQIGLPARAARRVLRYTTFGKDKKQWFSSYTVHGGERLKQIKGPAVIIANHSSHYDFCALMHALPPRLRRRVTMAAAADRFYTTGRKGYRKQPWWFSLAQNCFPMKRSGGRAALEYPESLLGKGWSVAIFPEGGRASGSKMGKFKAGPALLAISKQVPVIPLYMDGLAAIRPKGSKANKPGPVEVWVGEPLTFGPDTDAAEATHVMYNAVDWLRRQAAATHRPARPPVVDLTKADTPPPVAANVSDIAPTVPDIAPALIDIGPASIEATPDAAGENSAAS